MSQHFSVSCLNRVSFILSEWIDSVIPDSAKCYMCLQRQHVDTHTKWEWFGPEPIPHPITHPAVITLVKTTQEQLLAQYNAYGIIACFIQGDTNRCQGPWLNGRDWNNASLARSIVKNTANDHRWECSSDQTYLSRARRVFYGFTSENATQSLQSIAHSASMFSAVTCALNTSCATTYNNDTSQMYYDFRAYINSTFFDYMAKNLPQDKSQSFCPPSIASSASRFTIATTPFQSGKEYFGLHDAVFIPGVSSSINGTIEEAKKELNGLLGNNARKSEGVFLNMVFFSFGSPLGLTRRSTDDEEVYPGCKRRTWIIDGKCEGVVPPREFDLAGAVIPMVDRDRLEVLAELSGLVLRDDQCDATKKSIENSRLAFEVGKALLDAAAVAVDEFPAIVKAAELAEFGGPAIAILGGAGMAIVMSVAACEAFNDCSGFPPVVKAAARTIMGETTSDAAAGILQTLFGGDKSRWEPLFKALKAMTEPEGLGLNLAEIYTDYIMDAAIDYYKQAEACCGDSCESAVCQQAGRGCLLNTGSFWTATENIGLNCLAT